MATGRGYHKHTFTITTDIRTVHVAIFHIIIRLVSFFRESNDFERDDETIHHIVRVYLPDNSGDPYATDGRKTDFAIIQTEADVNICSEPADKRLCWHIDPVRLPGPNIQIPNLQVVRTLGWGETEEAFGQSEYLAQLDITINTINIAGNASNHFILETNVGENGADPCHGDSGGPLLLREEDGKWILVATLLGGGYECGDPSSPDKTSDWNRVSTHVKWMNTIIKGNPKDPLKPNNEPGSGEDIVAVQPTKGLSCQNSWVCATRDSCHHWQKKDRELNNTRRGSAAYKKLIKEYKSAICNRADKGLCCPNKETISVWRSHPDPCNPWPCGPNTSCTARQDSHSCSCLEGYVPMQGTNKGCKRECERDPDCSSEYICRNYQCVEKSDPCKPWPCGPNASCRANNQGSHICSCLDGYVPMQDPIKGCKRECERDPDCSSGYICRNYQCVEKPDPCKPWPCGPNASCRANNQGSHICSCQAGYVPITGAIEGCKRECERDPDCSSGYICRNYQCIGKPVVKPIEKPRVNPRRRPMATPVVKPVLPGLNFNSGCSCNKGLLGIIQTCTCTSIKYMLQDEKGNLYNL